MKFRAITGWALLAKQREYWPPILVQGALIPQSFILPSGFLPEGEEGGRAVRIVVKHEFPLLSGTYTVPKSFAFSPSVYLQALDVPETSCSFQYRHKAPCNHYWGIACRKYGLPVLGALFPQLFSLLNPLFVCFPEGGEGGSNKERGYA